MFLAEHNLKLRLGMPLSTISILMHLILVLCAHNYQLLTHSNIRLCLSKRLSTRLHLSYLGVYSSRNWSEEENGLLLVLRSERINPETGRVRRGGWKEISSILSARLGEKISVEKAQHQADNVMRRRKRKALLNNTSKKLTKLSTSGKMRKWSSRENDVLMLIRSRNLDNNGRVTGSWGKICNEATAELGLSKNLTVAQAMKRVKDIQRRAPAQEAHGRERDRYRGWNLRTLSSS